MDSSTQSTAKPSASAPVLKGRAAKKEKVRSYWSGMGAIWIGVCIVISGAMMSLTLGGDFPRVCYLVGMALFALGLIVEMIVLVIRLIRER